MLSLSFLSTICKKNQCLCPLCKSFSYVWPWHAFSPSIQNSRVSLHACQDFSLAMWSKFYNLLHLFFLHRETKEIKHFIYYWSREKNDNFSSRIINSI